MAPESKSTGQDLRATSASGRSEAELVVAAERGEAGAFEELVVMTQDRLYNLTFRMTGHHEEAEDVLQETYLRAHRSLASFEGGSQFYTWLYRIAVNACLSRGRKLGRRHEFESASLDASFAGSDGESTLGASFAAGDGDPLEAASLLERERRVHEAISALPEEYRTVIVLRDIEGLSYDDVGKVTRSTRAAVKSRLHRARARLAELLADLR